MIKFLASISLLSFIFLSSCSNQNVQTSHFSNVYGTKNVTISPKFKVYHNSIEESELHFQFSSGEVLYARMDKSQPYHANVTIAYEAYDYDNKKLLVDSSSMRINDTVQQKSSKWINGKLPMKLIKGKKYRITVFATDENRNNTYEERFVVDKENEGSEQFYLVTDKEEGTIFYQNFVTKPTEVIITSEVNKGRSIFASQYFRSFSIAAPPFAHPNHKSFDYQPDEQHEYYIDNNGQFQCLLLDTGFVNFRIDTSQKKGLAVFGFESNYPKIKNVYGMIGPLRFISSNTEYEELSSSEEPKKSVDMFWLSKSGNEDRGREVIKRYYNRVQDANDNFTSYLEGWKTDRGMVSIVYGTPKSVRNSRDEEVWYYGEETNSFTLQFTFVKVDNPFSENDYKLIRATSYKSSWYRAVDAWRSGRVYWAQY